MGPCFRSILENFEGSCTINSAQIPETYAVDISYYKIFLVYTQRQLMDVYLGPVSELMLQLSLTFELAIDYLILWDSDSETALEIAQS